MRPEHLPRGKTLAIALFVMQTLSVFVKISKYQNPISHPELTITSSYKKECIILYWPDPFQFKFNFIAVEQQLLSSIGLRSDKGQTCFKILHYVISLKGVVMDTEISKTVFLA